MVKRKQGLFEARGAPTGLASIQQSAQRAGRHDTCVHIRCNRMIAGVPSRGASCDGHAGSSRERSRSMQTLTPTVTSRTKLKPLLLQHTALLVTYRRDGRPVGTPVSIAVEGDRA